MADGNCLAVDFTGASGADTMLVTSAKADGQSVKVGGKKLTFYFPTAKDAPRVKAEGDTAVVGKQKVMLKDGHVVFGTAGK
jgi:lipopolysaccharide export system protein LptA